MYSSILHDAADHFVHDLGNITFANVVHRMMLLSSEDQELRSIQYPYIKRLLVQFASMFIRGVAFSVRDREHEIEDPVPIDIVDNMMDADIDNSDYDAAISNPALDAAVAYQAIVTTDMNFDSSSHNDNVSSALIRRSIALAEIGSQRAELSLRRASRLAALRHQQFQEVQRLLQEAIREREREQVVNQQQENQDNQIQAEQNVNIVISEHEEEEDSNPYGLEF
jgi:DNA polymerase III alpha subunit (gram-positive type)